MTEQIELADSHAHLDLEEFDRDRDEVLQRAWESGVRAILCPAEMTTPASLATVLGLAEKFSRVEAAAGIHPHLAKEFAPSLADKIQELGRAKQIKAVGEIGLDYHYNFSPPEKQREVFRTQLRLAQELALPVIVHSRNSGRDVIAAVEEEGFTRGGVLHCFTEDWETAEQMMDRNFFISFSGILTYPNAQSLREIAKKIPWEKLLVETDSPYLVPQPRRGKNKRNEPAFVIETVQVLASLRNIHLEEMARATLENFRRLFSV
jgi:TatD DNase family protein